MLTINSRVFFIILEVVSKLGFHSSHRKRVWYFSILAVFSIDIPYVFKLSILLSHEFLCVISYKIIEIINDKVYVIDSADDQSKIDINKSREKFITEISKHKYHFSNHPHLDELTDKIDCLEDIFSVKSHDDNWKLTDINDPLKDSVFNLTPWQKIVYDSINENTSFGDIEKSLSMYKSGNFKNKITKNLDELLDEGLIFKNEKGNFSKKIL